MEKHTLFKMLIIALCITFSIPTVYGSDLQGEPTTKEEPTIIEIIGIFETHKDRSLVLPLEAYLDGSQLTLTFFDAIEDVTISILGNSDTVETRTVSFTDFQTETFDVSRYAVGSYSLLITTPRGTYLLGNFKIGI
ncbi:DUF3244 domain-containing protein [Phocaeicola faecalis]|uniref:DUF3244 domain-containing protein n=1 Tax=Phocaeicola faecalis TaxID=2786956 RepID=UPI001F176E14|nr:DUF3244 domain-containing protein [Phocaeicola faecalis]